MELNVEMFLFYALTEFKRDTPAATIHKNLIAAWGDRAPAYSTICHWIAKWKQEEPISLADDSRCGRPVSICTDENIDVTRQLITDDPHTIFI